MLKPCPMCGSEMDHEDSDCMHPSSVGWIDQPLSENIARRYVRATEVPPEQRCWEIHCVKHYGGCGVNVSGDTKQEAIDNWNRRI